MYSIVDLIENKTVGTYPDKTHVLRARGYNALYHCRGLFLFLREDLNRCSHRFDASELNVTGEDIKPNAKFRLFVSRRRDVNDSRYNFQVSGDTPVLRRYAVLDDAGRHVDIREWADEIADVEKNPFPEIGHYDFGMDPDVIRAQRIRGTAMWRQGLREAAEGFAECEYAPVRDDSKPRARGFTIGGATDICELKAAGRRGMNTRELRTKPKTGGKQLAVRKRQLHNKKKWADFEADWGSSQLDQASGF